MGKQIDWIRFFPSRVRHRLRYEINRLLPQPIRRAAKHRRYVRYKKKFHKQIAKMTGFPPVDVEQGPPQSPEVALSTSVMTQKGLEGAVDPDLYFAGAYKTMHRFLRELELVGFELGSVRAILDFGCGSAKFARILRCMPGVRIIGADKNIRCIEWCRKNIPGVQFYVNEDHPPLSLAEDNAIDLIIAYSVFTHIPLEIQKSWLQELFRIMRPGGVFFCTVLGDFHAFKMLSAQEQKQLKQEGHYSLKPISERISLSSKVTGQHDVFQTRAEILRVFSDSFEILRYRKAEPQNVLVLRKPLSP